MNNKEFYTIQQIMSKLQVCDETVYRWIRKGELRAIKVGGLVRVSKASFEEFMRRAEITNASD